MGFTTKQRLFIEYYLQSWNATDAAIKAGYSEKTARFIGSENLTKPNIAEEIQHRIDEVAMGADEVLLTLAEIARSGIEDFMNVDESGKLVFDFARAKKSGKLGMIKKVVPTRNGLKVELHDRMKALELIGKHNGLFNEKIELTGKDGEDLIPLDKVVEALKRIDGGSADTD